jgi:hypothetical protein
VKKFATEQEAREFAAATLRGDAKPVPVYAVSAPVRISRESIASRLSKRDQILASAKEGRDN